MVAQQNIGLRRRPRRPRVKRGQEAASGREVTQPRVVPAWRGGPAEDQPRGPGEVVAEPADRAVDDQVVGEGIPVVQLVEQIQRLNPSASAAWLGRFDRAALRMYLAHLVSVLEGPGKSWVRPGDTPAIVCWSA